MLLTDEVVILGIVGPVRVVEVVGILQRRAEYSRPPERSQWRRTRMCGGHTDMEKRPDLPGYGPAPENDDKAVVFSRLRWEVGGSS